MTTIYLDNNVLSGLGGQRKWPDHEGETAALGRLQATGAQVALSAWHAVELAQWRDAESVRQCCDLADAMRPVWANNPIAVKREEIIGYLERADGTSDRNTTVRPFSPTIPQMWGSYSGVVLLDETFPRYVAHLQDHPDDLKTITDAADQTPAAIAIGRAARADGRWDEAQPLVDAAYFQGLLGCGDEDARLKGIMDNLSEVYRACPTVAVEEELTSVRVRERFKPQRAHAVDLQHALLAVAHADAFVTDDRDLLRHCQIVAKTLRLKTKICRRIAELA